MVLALAKLERCFSISLQNLTLELAYSYALVLLLYGPAATWKICGVNRRETVLRHISTPNQNSTQQPRSRSLPGHPFSMASKYN